MRKQALLFILGLVDIPVAHAENVQPPVLNAAGGSAIVSGNDAERLVGDPADAFGIVQSNFSEDETYTGDLTVSV